jgi:hypothetical protein
VAGKDIPVSMGEINSSDFCQKENVDVSKLDTSKRSKVIGSLVKKVFLQLALLLLCGWERYTSIYGRNQFDFCQKTHEENVNVS